MVSRRASAARRSVLVAAQDRLRLYHRPQCNPRSRGARYSGTSATNDRAGYRTLHRLRRRRELHPEIDGQALDHRVKIFCQAFKFTS